MNDIVEIIASLVECCIFIRICTGFLGYKSNKLKWLKILCAYIPLGLVDVFLTQLDGFENISAIILLLIMLVFSFDALGGKIWEKILVPIIPTITALPINLIVMSVFTIICDNNRAEVLPGGAMRVPVLFFTKAIFFITCEFIIRIRRKQSKSLTGFQWMIQMSCFMISFLISTFLWNIYRNQTENQSPFLVIFVLIAAMNILLYVLMYKMQRNNVTREEINLLRSNIASQERFAVETRERYTEMKTLRHDMKHYLSTAAELISDGRADNALTYIESVINEKISPMSVGVDTGSAVIDAVINRRIAECNEKHIEMKCLIDTKFVSEYDIDVSILLSNLLDNAITGCESCKAPKIDVTVKKIKSLTYILISNSIERSVLTSNPSLQSDKEDKSVHGYGIRSVKNIAEKYDGRVTFKEEKGTFQAEIWLNLEK